ncbi:crotonyl-CoA carboxylase/reductase [Streptomyces sp. TLI_146]|uniref:crotonyl-CoA carboxylase/reductase n=1 Tax=Streptomyces sp. TLI_146 TaxID=1938858 RepID=UPI000C71371C|nr:crotonyl-CoA carboxylase/reductase [Streptomyces sp. TLI_146]PKV77061.1 crotonyl-CoA reductase [Streptomyces sp. TLI_146]
MDALAEAVIEGAPPGELERAAVPYEYTAAHLRKDEVEIFGDAADRDVRRSLRVGAVPMPELAPDEVLIATMASAVDHHTLAAATFAPRPSFAALEELGREGGFEQRHDQPFHAVGSDAAGVVVRVGSAVRRWNVGDHVVVAGAWVDSQEPATHADGMLSGEQRIWGAQTNYGGLGHYSLARADQLLPKAPHLTWEEAASSTLCASTAYRMLVGERGARVKQGDIVLIWGAAGGIGSFAVQLVRNAGGIAVGVVSGADKARRVAELGCDVVIDRTELGLDESGLGAAELGRRLGRVIRSEVGEDPHIAFDATGEATFGISVYVVRRGGVVVTCGSGSGAWHTFDNRYLWMNLKRVIGSHAANYQEAWECNRLLTLGRLSPVLSRTYPLAEVGEAARLLQDNAHLGKVGVLCLAPREGLGVTDPALRERIGEAKLRPFHAGALTG